MKVNEKETHWFESKSVSCLVALGLPFPYVVSHVFKLNLWQSLKSILHPMTWFSSHSTASIWFYIVYKLNLNRIYFYGYISVCMCVSVRMCLCVLINTHCHDKNSKQNLTTCLWSLQSFSSSSSSAATSSSWWPTKTQKKNHQQQPQAIRLVLRRIQNPVGNNDKL